jgi:hypothetical protein
MTGFNYKESQITDCCGNCYQGISHLSRGLICGHTDKATRRDHLCGLYIRKQVKEKKKTEPEGQEELF